MPKILRMALRRGPSLQNYIEIISIESVSCSVAARDRVVMTFSHFMRKKGYLFSLQALILLAWSLDFSFPLSLCAWLFKHQSSTPVSSTQGSRRVREVSSEHSNADLCYCLWSCCMCHSFQVFLFFIFTCFCLSFPKNVIFMSLETL